MMILGSLATITDQVNKLVELLSIASPYARASFYANKHPHVVVCGSMTVVFYFLCFPADVLCCRLCFDARCLGLAILTTHTWLRRVFHFANADEFCIFEIRRESNPRGSKPPSHTVCDLNHSTNRLYTIGTKCSHHM